VVSINAAITASLDGMMQRGLNVGRVVMDSGVVEAQQKTT
jgi:hypothetical protein